VKLEAFFGGSASGPAQVVEISIMLLAHELLGDEAPFGQKLESKKMGALGFPERREPASDSRLTPQPSSETLGPHARVREDPASASSP